MARKSDDPITVYGGEKKSAMAVPSRRNSGHMATATSGPESLEGGLQYGRHILDRSGWHRAANHDGVECTRRHRGTERMYEVFQYAVDVGEVGLATRRRRRANTQERRVGVLQRIDRADGGVQVPGRDGGCQHGFQTRLNDGTVAG